MLGGIPLSGAYPLSFPLDSTWRWMGCSILFKIYGFLAEGRWGGRLINSRRASSLESHAGSDQIALSWRRCYPLDKKHASQRETPMRYIRVYYYYLYYLDEELERHSHVYVGCISLFYRGTIVQAASCCCCCCCCCRGGWKRWREVWITIPPPRPTVSGQLRPVPCTDNNETCWMFGHTSNAISSTLAFRFNSGKQ